MSGKFLTIASLGGGVQSTAMVLMSKHGELPPLDYCVFADTGAEPHHVYSHLEWLEEELDVPVITVKNGNLWKEHFDSAENGTRVANAPFYTLKNGEKGILRRVCTVEKKINPIIKEIRRLLGFSKGQRVKDAQCEQWIGLDVQELTRMKESPHPKWLTNRWPLIEKRMSRHDCKLWMEKNGYPEPPRSACIMCPYHGNAYWRFLKNEHPQEWADAVRFDKKIRTGIHNTEADALFLHNDCVPLDEVDLRTDIDKGQMSWLDECSGGCFS